MSEDDHIAAVRSFSRFFDTHIGAFNQRFAKFDATVPEIRVLYEVGVIGNVKAAYLCSALGIDRSNMSRIISNLETSKEWIYRKQLEGDARAKSIRLTPKGESMFKMLNEHQNSALKADLDRLTRSEQKDLINSLTMAKLIYAKAVDATALIGQSPGFSIREFNTGDIALIASRQSKMYKEHFNWGRQLETNIIKAACDFLQEFKLGREQGFIAEIEGCFSGSILITDEGDSTARIRLFHVEQYARRRGIGDALVKNCIEFATQCNYKVIILWTHTVLESARRIYSKNGFHMYETSTHTHFGVPVQGEMWRLQLV